MVKMRQRHSEVEKQRLLEKFKTSGQTALDFCLSNGITDRTLRLWRAEERRNRNTINENGVITVGNNRPPNPVRPITAHDLLDAAVRQLNLRPEPRTSNVAYIRMIINC